MLVQMLKLMVEHTWEGCFPILKQTLTVHVFVRRVTTYMYVHILYMCTTMYDTFYFKADIVTCVDSMHVDIRPEHRQYHDTHI